VSESTVTNPVGSDRKRRTMDEISDSFNKMLVGEPEEQPEPVEAEDSFEEEQEVESCSPKLSKPQEPASSHNGI